MARKRVRVRMRVRALMLGLRQGDDQDSTWWRRRPIMNIIIPISISSASCGRFVIGWFVTVSVGSTSTTSTTTVIIASTIIWRITGNDENKKRRVWTKDSEEQCTSIKREVYLIYSNIRRLKSPESWLSAKSTTIPTVSTAITTVSTAISTVSPYIGPSIVAIHSQASRQVQVFKD